MSRTLALSLAVFSSCVAYQRNEVRDPAPVVPPPVVLSVRTFVEHLAPYGRWHVVPVHGLAWEPSEAIVGRDFFPYGTGGAWVSTHAGWMFHSRYPFGWAVFHYGRWVQVRGYGWLWLPGDTWAPAWVAWRTGGPLVGWAPLGPEGAPPFSPETWCFVGTKTFTSPHVHRFDVRARDVFRAAALTSPVGRFGPPPSSVVSPAGLPVVPLPMDRLPSLGRKVPPPPPPATAMR